ncbi:hypothetical protein MUK42_37383 [Musa troglodytarum]|uniref:Uncharacterized protein n=1 Tax=Musa troglodytarum TaxID=320322 RepID=A0A9E7EGH6_9LILI|nr:hypothetical protein MUK42_37383 [Musa troglodytarum]
MIHRRSHCVGPTIASERKPKIKGVALKLGAIRPKERTTPPKALIDLLSFDPKEKRSDGDDPNLRPLPSYSLSSSSPPLVDRHRPLRSPSSVADLKFLSRIAAETLRRPKPLGYHIFCTHQIVCSQMSGDF